ncbi:MAG: hypothetical protein ABIY55_25545, partial [Kofleriaceae bacterium]
MTMSRTLLLLLLAAIPACTFVVDRSTSQCEVDADCAHFEGNLTCQQGVCSSLGPQGCFHGTP